MTDSAMSNSATTSSATRRSAETISVSLDELRPMGEGKGSGKELRLALAMRGGVSLAVWIGGAVAEIDRMRRGAKPYDQLLADAGYDDVIVDVMSGTSAGGLNGALYLAAQAYDFGLEGARDLWMDVADIEKFARKSTAGERAKFAHTEDAVKTLSREEALRPPSLLMADDYLYQKLRRSFRQLKDEADAARNAEGIVAINRDELKFDRADLILTATLVDPEDVATDHQPWVDNTQRSEASFRFSWSDETERDDAVFIDKLAMAARTTSSYPFAFEPAQIPVITAADENDGSPESELNFKGIFEPPVPNRTGRYEVMDGGVLDNIPVAAAIDAVLAAEADGETDRWIVYLHPSPKQPSEMARLTPETTDRMKARGVTTLMRTIAAQMSTETVADDYERLRAVNEQARQREAARQTLFSSLPDGEALASFIADSGTELRGLLARHDAERILSHVRSTGSPTNTGMRTWSQTGSELLAEELQDALTNRMSSMTIGFAEDAIDLLIALARQLEASPNVDAALVGERKLALYQQDLGKLRADERAQWIATIPNDEPVVAPGILDTDKIARLVKTLDLLDMSDISEETWDDLVGHLEALRAAAGGADRSTWEPGPFELLLSSDIPASRALLQVNLVSQTVNQMGRGPWGQLKFVHMSGDAEFALDDAHANPAQKLCGNELGSFAGFLSAEWRANDWMWGRLDAASTLVDHLMGPATDQAGLDQRTAQKRAIQQQIFEENVRDEHCDSTKYSVGLQTPASLPPRRRLQIGLRMVHLFFAVVRPAATSVSGVVARAALTLAKAPALVIAFGLLAPMRSLLSLSVGLTTLQLAFIRPGDTLAQWLVPAASAIGQVALVWGASQAQRKAATIPGPSSPRTPLTVLAIVLLAVFGSAAALWRDFSLPETVGLATRGGTEMLSEGLDNRVLWVLGATAIVGFIASGWMRRSYALGSAVLSTIVGAALLGVTAEADKTLLLPIKWWSIVALVILVGAYCWDTQKLLRFADWERSEFLAWVTSFVVVTLGAVAVAAVIWGGGLSLSLVAWSLLTIVTAPYANMHLATYLPVFEEPGDAKTTVLRPLGDRGAGPGQDTHTQASGRAGPDAMRESDLDVRETTPVTS